MKINKKNLSAVLVFSLVLFFGVCLNLHYSLAEEANEENTTPVYMENGIINFADLGYQFDKISDVKINGKLLPQTAFLFYDQCINLNAVGINYTDNEIDTLTFTYENETIELNITPDIMSTTYMIYINKQNFPDEVFREYISENADKDKDGFLTKKEISDIKSIDFEGHFASDLPGDKSKQIKSLKGINIFENLENLTINNNVFKTLDLTGLVNLKNIFVHNSGICNVKGLDSCTKLETLNLSNNNLSNIDLSKNTSLKSLNLSSNHLNNLDSLKDLPSLESLNLSSNNISNIDLSNNTSLKSLNLENNSLQCLNLSQYKSLKEVALGEQHVHDIPTFPDRIKDVKDYFPEYNDRVFEYYDISYFDLDKSFDKNKVNNLSTEQTDHFYFGDVLPLISDNKLFVYVGHGDGDGGDVAEVFHTCKSSYDYKVPYGNGQETSMHVIWEEYHYY